MPKLSKNKKLKERLDNLKERLAKPSVEKSLKDEARPAILTKEEKRKAKSKQLIDRLTAQAESKHASKKVLDLGELRVTLNELELNKSKTELLDQLAAARSSTPQAKTEATLGVRTGPKSSHRKFARTKVATETKQFGSVLNHPAYKQDPFGTIQMHLANTIKMQQEQRKK